MVVAFQMKRPSLEEKRKTKRGIGILPLLLQTTISISQSGKDRQAWYFKEQCKADLSSSLRLVILVSSLQDVLS